MLYWERKREWWKGVCLYSDSMHVHCDKALQIWEREVGLWQYACMRWGGYCPHARVTDVWRHREGDGPTIELQEAWTDSVATQAVCSTCLKGYVPHFKHRPQEELTSDSCTGGADWLRLYVNTTNSKCLLQHGSTMANYRRLGQVRTDQANNWLCCLSPCADLLIASGWEVGEVRDKTLLAQPGCRFMF